MTESIGTPTAEDLLAWHIDTLIGMRQEWREQGQKSLALAAKAEFAIIQQMTAKGATVHASDEWEAKLGPGTRNYRYHMNVLEALKPLLRDGEWEKLVQERTVFDVDKRTMNRLELRGGDIALIIQKATMESEGPPRLNIERMQSVNDNR